MNLPSSDQERTLIPHNSPLLRWKNQVKISTSKFQVFSLFSSHLSLKCSTRQYRKVIRFSSAITVLGFASSHKLRTRESHTFLSCRVIYYSHVWRNQEVERRVWEWKVLENSWFKGEVQANEKTYSWPVYKWGGGRKTKYSDRSWDQRTFSRIWRYQKVMGAHGVVDYSEILGLGGRVMTGAIPIGNTCSIKNKLLEF